MSNPQLSLWLAAIAVGMFSAWRNPTALALLLAFVASERGLPLDYYVYPDILTLTVIFCKPEYAPCADYGTVWHQLKCVITERSPSDRIVMLSLPAAWFFYVAPVDPNLQWWSLYGLAMIQFAAVIIDHVPDLFSRRRNADAVPPPDHLGSLLVAYFAGGRLA